jgi:hypothetical protein
MICGFWSIAKAQSTAEPTGGSVECPMDAAFSTTKTTRTIPASRVNDDYCDCPLTGADEPNTSACAGSLDWPGIVTAVAAAEKQKEEALYVFHR